MATQTCSTCGNPSASHYCGGCLDRVRARLRTETDLYYHIGPFTGSKVVGVLPGKYPREFWTKKRMRQVRYASLVVIGILGVLLAVEVRNRRVAAEAEYWRGVGMNCFEAQDWPGAIDGFTRSLNLKPDSKTHLFRGAAHMNRREYPAAIMDCEEALRLDPGCWEARKNMETVRRR